MFPPLLISGASTSNPLDVVTAVRICALVKFMWGSSNVARYARADQDVNVSGDGLYISTPNLELNFSDQHGGVEDSPLTLTMRTALQPAPQMVDQQMAPVTVTTFECDPTNAAATLRLTFKGRVSESEENPVGRSGLMKLTVRSLKDQLRASLGIIVDEKCPWTFGDAICKKDLAPLRKSAVLSSINGARITVPSTIGVTDESDGYWRWGSVKYDGYEISIKDWIRPDVFILVRTPPREWLGQTLTFTPGDDKTIECCRRWNNEENFGGAGTAMPNRNLLLQTGEE